MDWIDAMNSKDNCFHSCCFNCVKHEDCCTRERCTRKEACECKADSMDVSVVIEQEHWFFPCLEFEPKRESGERAVQRPLRGDHMDPARGGRNGNHALV